MSLDVYLIAASGQPRPKGGGVYFRENGQTRELTREEWDERFPGKEPIVVEEAGDSGEVFSYNITHNLGPMAAAAGIYEALWRPEEIDVTKASGLILLLRAGIEKLRAEPETYKKLNPDNGWGDYDGLLRFASCYLSACEDWPDATIRVSR